VLRCINMLGACNTALRRFVVVGGGRWHAAPQPP
jgi:hypothetical protein